MREGAKRDRRKDAATIPIRRNRAARAEKKFQHDPSKLPSSLTSRKTGKVEARGAPQMFGEERESWKKNASPHGNVKERKVIVQAPSLQNL